MKRRIVLATALAAVALSGCETLYPDNRHPLTDKQWQLTEIQRPSQPVVTIPRNLSGAHTMMLNSDGSASYQLDCNRGNGTWQGERPINGNGSLMLGEIASTRALCPAPSYGEEMAGALPLASSYYVSPDGRRLEVRARIGTYVFTTR